MAVQNLMDIAERLNEDNNSLRFHNKDQELETSFASTIEKL